MANTNTDHQWALLKNIGMAYEAELIRSMLNQCNIPVLQKSSGSGNYTDIYMGTSLTGYNIYVPASQLTEARDILASIEPIDQNSSEADEIQSDAAQGGYILQNRELFKKIFIILFIIPNVLGLLYFVFQTIKDVFKNI